MKEILRSFDNIQMQIEAIVSDADLDNEHQKRGDFEDSLIELISQAEEIVRKSELSTNSRNPIHQSISNISTT